MASNKEIEELLKAELDKPIDPKGDYPVLDDEGIPMVDRHKLTKGDVLIKQIISKGMRGDSKTMEQILDRLYGKSPQHIKQEVVVSSYHTFLEDCAARDAEFVEEEDQLLLEDDRETDIFGNVMEED